MTNPNLDDVKALAELDAAITLLIREDGDRDHMNHSNITCEHSMAIVALLRYLRLRLASQREDGDAVMAETNRCAQIVRSCVGTDCDFETAAQLILNRNFK